MAVQAIQSVKSNAIFYCATLNPDPAQEHVVLAGASDKKIYQFDLKSGDMVQVRFARCVLPVEEHFKIGFVH